MKWVIPKTYTNPIYPLKKVSDMNSNTPTKHQVAIIGAGPVGLTTALDLANRGISSVVFSKENSVSIGSRALCFSKKCLEIVHRINPDAVSRMINKGITWNLGKVFYKNEEVYKFNLLPEEGHKIPAFINLQQYYFEEYLADEAHKNPLIDLRWQSKAHFIAQDDDKVTLKIETETGNYTIESEYLLACDGVHSPTRNAMNLPFKGELFEENFLIADITMENDFPTERWFWFDPPFNKGYSALLHKEPDGVWRIDLQLGRDGIDKTKELDQERIKERLRKMLGDDCKFELEWTSIYNFRCMRMDNLIHDRVIFAGDSAHQVSPFGARGANGGVQDSDNLSWKLAYVIKGLAPKSLLDTYQEERSPAADENIYHSSNATDFISPKSKISTIFRNQTLDLAKDHVFAQKLVNSGRLSNAFKYLDSSLTSTDNPSDDWQASLQPGYSFNDVELKKHDKTTYLIDELGHDFTLIVYGEKPEGITDLTDMFNVKVIVISDAQNHNGLVDNNNYFKNRYDAQKGSWYLLRPDHYIASRGKVLDNKRIKNAILKATNNSEDHSKSNIKDMNPQHLKDDMYKALIESHEGLTEEESHKLNAKLILLLMDKTEDINEWNDLINSAKAIKAHNVLIKS
ncbi:FAD-dependent monooxygenase [Flavivirga abyssicola]|uniref:FAD-dependent monooxygenase n=1 Tax=Flavivirga abyssicola TaxID=3063533 RepID=UPI0026E08B69|nr:FAD-dependent monooxygenase [Flavivirga sp. MEBiC07777]WVK11699.1 FAD-dependent monooxygenase [Flavivirga sp. MEBiC07777]